MPARESPRTPDTHPNGLPVTVQFQLHFILLRSLRYVGPVTKRLRTVGGEIRIRREAFPRINPPLQMQGQPERALLARL